MASANRWKTNFEEHGILWFHDGNPKRPYARLTSGKISNGFFDGAFLASEHPALFGEAVRALVTKARLTQSHSRLIGPAEGAIALVTSLGIAARRPYAWAKKIGDGQFAFDPRFAQYMAPDDQLQLCEDTISTGGSVLSLEQAALRTCPSATFASEIVAICNRTGSERLGDRAIVSLVNLYMPMWDEGNNPFTPDGKELVEPVRPKGQRNLLTQAY